MKKHMLLIVVGILVTGLVWSQDQNTRIPLLGEMAPVFTAKTTNGKLNFPGDFPNKWKILFSHPADFTPVCSSEILQLASMQEEFEELNTKIMVLSTDGLNSHMAWINSLETINYPDDESYEIKFPLIADPDHEISKKYGMIHSYTSSTRDVRGVFFIDPTDRILAIFFYPMYIGRNMEEIKRTLIALQTAEKHYVLTPANWDPGENVLVRSPATQKEAEKMEKLKGDDMTSLSWYMWFKELPQAKL